MYLMWHCGNKATLRDSLIATFVTAWLKSLRGLVSSAGDAGHGKPPANRGR